MNPARTAEPAVEPITLAEAKLHLSVDMIEHDALITALIVAARQFAEAKTGRSLITTSWLYVADGFPCRCPLTIDRCPVQSVTSVQYLDMAGAWQTMPPADYVADLQSEPARITPVFGKTWPIPMPQIGSVRVAFSAGYGATAESVPEGIKAWMKLRIGALYENREEVIVASRIVVAELPYVDGLLDGYRLVTM